MRRPFWGRVNCNVAPRLEFAVAHTRPPCDSTMERVIANPIPVPLRLGGKECVKDLVHVFGGQSHADIGDRDQQLTIFSQV